MVIRASATAAEKKDATEAEENEVANGNVQFSLEIKCNKFI